MTKKSDFLFLNLKQLYPNFCRPAPLDEEIWIEMLEGYSEETIKKALKSHRESKSGVFIPTIPQMRELLELYKPCVKPEEDDGLPDRPASYLMDEDIKAHRRKYFYPTYPDAVDYILYELLYKTIGEESRGLTDRQRYRRAVDLGLFGNLDKILDFVYDRKVRP